MFEIDWKARRLSYEEKEQYKNEGYVTSLPVFSEKAINHMTKKEKHLIEAAKEENFNIDKLKEAWSKASNEKWEE